MNEPLPSDVATGIVTQPQGPVRAKSSSRSPLKSPQTAFAPKVEAQVGKFVTVAFVVVKRALELGLANAIGIVPQNSGPVSAMSSLPSPLKSQAKSFTPSAEAQTGNPAS